MKNFYRWLVKTYNLGTPAGEKLYGIAVGFLGTDASPNDLAPDEYGCAETVNDIVFAAFGDYAGGDLSTYRMYKAIQNNEMFVQVTSPLKGDIILCPTGYSNSREVPNGHVGIVGDKEKIMSNDSAKGTFEQNYTLKTWTARYKTKGGYPIYYFRRVFIS